MRYILNKQEFNLLTKIFHDGGTHTIYVDSDSVKVDVCIDDTVKIDGRDRTPCMYDYAKELLTVLK